MHLKQSFRGQSNRVATRIRLDDPKSEKLCIVLVENAFSLDTRWCAAVFIGKELVRLVGPPKSKARNVK